MDSFAQLKAEIQMEMYKAQMALEIAKVQAYTAHVRMYAAAAQMICPKVFITVEGCTVDLDYDQDVYQRIVNEMILVGSWLALTLRGKEVTERYFVRINVTENGITMKGQTFRTAVDTRMDGVSIGAYQNGGERLYLPYESGDQIITSGHEVVVEGSYTIGER